MGVSKYECYKNTGITNGVLSQMNGLSEDNLMRFLSYYTDISYTWLLTGEGSMLRTEHSLISSNVPLQQISGEAAAYYRMYKEKDNKVEELLKENAYLQERLRLYKSDPPSAKKIVDNASIKDNLSQPNPPVTSVSAPLKKHQSKTNL